jgi:hypothetical protein
MKNLASRVLQKRKQEGYGSQEMLIFAFERHGQYVSYFGEKYDFADNL